VLEFLPGCFRLMLRYPDRLSLTYPFQRSLYLFERYIIIGMNVQGEKGREIQIVGRISFDDVSTIFPYAPMPMPGRTLLLRNTPYFSHPLGRGEFLESRQLCVVQL